MNRSPWCRASEIFRCAAASSISIRRPSLLTHERLHDGPIRLDFFGDTIESLRAFDPFSQRSTTEIAEAILLPVTDILLDPSDTNGDGPASPGPSKTAAPAPGWDQEETATLVEQVDSGQRFAGMEFFLPLFYPTNQPPVRRSSIFSRRDTTLLLVEPEAINQNMELVHERIWQQFRRSPGRPATGPASRPTLSRCRRRPGR